MADQATRSRTVTWEDPRLTRRDAALCAHGVTTCSVFPVR